MLVASMFAAACASPRDAVTTATRATAEEASTPGGIFFAPGQEPAMLAGIWLGRGAEHGAALGFAEISVDESGVAQLRFSRYLNHSEATTDCWAAIDLAEALEVVEGRHRIVATTECREPLSGKTHPVHVDVDAQRLILTLPGVKEVPSWDALRPAYTMKRADPFEVLLAPRFTDPQFADGRYDFWPPEMPLTGRRFWVGCGRSHFSEGAGDPRLATVSLAKFAIRACSQQPCEPGHRVDEVQGACVPDGTPAAGGADVDVTFLDLARLCMHWGSTSAPTPSEHWAQMLASLEAGSGELRVARTLSNVSAAHTMGTYRALGEELWPGNPDWCPSLREVLERDGIKP